LKGLKEVKISRRKISAAIAWLLLVGGGIILLRSSHISPEQRLLKRFKKLILVKYGINIPPASGLHEAVRSIDNQSVKEFVAIYTGVLYRDKKLTKGEIIQLEQLLKSMTISSQESEYRSQNKNRRYCKLSSYSSHAKSDSG
jgi:hypothetical protein